MDNYLNEVLLIFRKKNYLYVAELYPNNQRALEKLSSLYGKQERYDEQVEILDLWLDFEICSADSDLDKDEETVAFGWDSTKYEDGECLLEIECTDQWGGVSTLYRNLDVKNQGLVYSIPPANIETNTVTKITSIVDYENPVSVNMIVAKVDADVLAEGQKIPMKKEGNYYTGELYFENSGNYVYSIEVDTGHGKLTSYENNIIVSEKQVVTSSGDNDNALVGPNILPILLILVIVAFRRKK